MSATLIYSVKPGQNPFVRVYSQEINPSVNRFMNAVFNNAAKMSSKRITVIGNRYCYTPSKEWKEMIFRFKGIK